ncbi:GPW/gp25 family protein [Roseateles sp. DAIF2]|uniref:GPW/gp25 family protein n=1 Tax=Roseateles sp. DAIF2 TaxID=2714952 RepID=UPI0018A2EDC5|nr:GPW/gp25 family protein [Roseateles sp. DAIF2]QPF73393.1 GPW/gp25 family protein [Roseateles sp. DAIF2]
MSFLGRGWSFPPRFDAEGRALLVENEQDVAESLRLLLATRCGERVMQPGYGTHLHQMLFENADEQTLTAIKDMLEKALLFYEPRVELEQIEARIAADDMARLELNLHYRIRSTNTRHNLVYPLYLDQASQPVEAR